MRSISVRDLQRKFFKESKNLPLLVTRRGKPAFVLTAYNKKDKIEIEQPKPAAAEQPVKVEPPVYEVPLTDPHGHVVATRFEELKSSEDEGQSNGSPDEGAFKSVDTLPKKWAHEDTPEWLIHKEEKQNPTLGSEIKLGQDVKEDVEQVHQKGWTPTLLQKLFGKR